MSIPIGTMSLMEFGHLITLTTDHHFSITKQVWVHHHRHHHQSTQAKNCIHIPFGPSPLLATITTKKVKKGQELFTSYGVVYWLGALSTTATRSVDDGAPGMTEKIQTQIVQSARDLQQAMEEAKRGYAVEMDDLTTVLGQLN